MLNIICMYDVKHHNMYVLCMYMYVFVCQLFKAVKTSTQPCWGTLVPHLPIYGFSWIA